MTWSFCLENVCLKNCAPKRICSEPGQIGVEQFFQTLRFEQRGKLAEHLRVDIDNTDLNLCIT